ncbi:MAG: putative sugar O-methyltransferase [Phycisphaerae bacterium]|nr:putative sugar O-methyltransferase [Phycisphaerae bacterium]
MSVEQSQSFRAGPVWTQIAEQLLGEGRQVDLATFRRPGAAVNSRLASWDPGHRSHMFFKHMLLNTAASESDLFYECFDRLGDTSMGDPLTIECRGRRIDLDYLLAAQEAALLRAAGVKLASVAEVGAGFGRTCHALVRNFALDRYTIVDLPETLAISSRYLKAVLTPAEFDRVQFVANTDAANVAESDLWVNIDSFAEMEPGVVRAYQAQVAAKGRWFYCRNPVCKYTPEMIGAAGVSKSAMEAALQSGLCREVADIYSETALAPHRVEAEQLYRPAPGWKTLVNEPSLPYRYYQHLLFAKGA